MTWKERIKPLYDKFYELGGYITWEGAISLDSDRPLKSDLLIQHWVVFHGEGLERKCRYYIVRIDLVTGGFEVYKPVVDSPMIQDCIDAI